MPKTRRKILPRSLTGLAGLACALCCALPFLIAAGVIGGATWAGLGKSMPAIAIVLVALAAGTWWWTSHHRQSHAGGCAGDNCSCAQST